MCLHCLQLIDMSFVVIMHIFMIYTLFMLDILYCIECVYVILTYTYMMHCNSSFTLDIP